MRYILNPRNHNSSAPHTLSISFHPLQSLSLYILLLRLLEVHSLNIILSEGLSAIFFPVSVWEEQCLIIISRVLLIQQSPPTPLNPLVRHSVITNRLSQSAASFHTFKLSLNQYLIIKIVPVVRHQSQTATVRKCTDDNAYFYTFI